MLVGVGVPVQTAEVAGVLDDADVVCLSDAVAPGAVADAQRELAVLLDRHGRANFNLLDLERQPDTAIGALAGDPALRALMDDLVRVACPAGEWPHLSASFGSALNVTVGTERPARVGTLHYDASIVTVVIPLLVPEVGAGQSGELVLFPNHRRLRRSVARNVVDKFRAQTGGTARRMLARAQRGDDGECLALREGNAYVFWGYRSMHGNLPCAAGSVRATLTLHGGDPHGRHHALRMLKRANEIRATRLGSRRVVH